MKHCRVPVLPSPKIASLEFLRVEGEMLTIRRNNRVVLVWNGLRTGDLDDGCVEYRAQVLQWRG